MRRLDIFGRSFLVERLADGGWALYHPGGEGKRRGPLLNVPIPAFVTDPDALVAYLADLCHEWATPAQSTVRWID